MAESGESFSCPKCGGPLFADGKNPTVTCSFCGASVIVPESLRPKPAPSAMDLLREAATRAAAEDAKAQPTASSYTSRTGSLLRFALIIIGLLIITYLGIRIIGARQEDQNSLSQVPGLAPTPTVTGFQRSLNIDLPRQVSYAGIVYRLDQGEIDNQDRSSDPPVNQVDQAFARLSFNLQNTTRDNIYLDPGQFKLHLAGGNDYPLDPNIVLNKDFHAPGPQSASTTSLVFPVPIDAGWEGAVLVISAPGAEPAMIPLSGPMPAAAYPQILQIPGSLAASAQGMDYSVRGVSLDLDDGAQRVEQGLRFLKLKLQISNTSLQYGGNISSSNFRLIMDGVSSEPKDAPIEVVSYQTSVTGEVVFEIPAGTTNAIFQVGNVTADSNDFGKIPLDLTQTSALP